MKQLLKKFRDAQQGMIALEATIGIVVFLMLMFAIYSIIPLLMAQSTIGHALSESCQSLAYETYATSKLDDGKFSVADLPISLVEAISTLGGGSVFDSNDAQFTTDARWFDLQGQPLPNNALIEQLAKDRFAAYLGGGTAEADRLLEALGVENGLDGLDFSGSTLDGSDLIIKVTYKISVLIQLGDFSSFESTQQVCSRIWGSA